MVRHPARGFSLVELMVTVAVTLLLGLASAPFTRSWGDQAAVRQTQSLVQQAMGQLRSTALRNASAVSSGPSAVLVSAGARLCVHAGTPATLTCNNALWTSTPVATLKLHDASDQCLAMDSAGLVQTVKIGAIDCGIQGNVEIKRGTETFNGSYN